jgi:hypothetical protein
MPGGGDRMNSVSPSTMPSRMAVMMASMGAAL